MNYMQHASGKRHGGPPATLFFIEQNRLRFCCQCWVRTDK